jgi:hypothetical protein
MPFRLLSLFRSAAWNDDGRALTHGSALKADPDHRAEYFSEAPIATMQHDIVVNLHPRNLK